MVASGSSRSAITVFWGEVSWVCVGIGVVRLIGMVAQCVVGCGVDLYLGAVCLAVTVYAVVWPKRVAELILDKL
jgi:hypothetical protein